METRRRATPRENRATLAALATVLHIRSVSPVYPGWPPSTEERAYLDAPRPSDSQDRKEAE